MIQGLNALQHMLFGINICLLVPADFDKAPLGPAIFALLDLWLGKPSWYQTFLVDCRKGRNAQCSKSCNRQKVFEHFFSRFLLQFRVKTCQNLLWFAQKRRIAILFSGGFCHS